MSSIYYRPSYQIDPIRLFLSSKAANIGSTRGNMTFSLNQSIAIPNEVIGFVSLIELEIPNTQYNINSLNNYIDGTLLTNNYNFTYSIPVGNYTVDSLRTQLNTTLSPNNITVTYDSSSNKFTFSNNVAGFRFNPTSTILPILGFESNSTPQTQGAGPYTLTSTRLVDLSGNNCFYLGTDLSTNNIGYLQSSGVMNGNILAKIQLTSEPNGIEFYNNYTNFKNKFYNRIISSIKIMLYDEDFIPWTPLSDWSCVLELTFFEQFEDSNKTLNRNSMLLSLKN